MMLRNCKIRIEPKGEPENDVVFWMADVIADIEGLSRMALNDEGYVELPVMLHIRPCKDIEDRSLNIGFYGAAEPALKAIKKTSKKKSKAKKKGAR